MDHINGPQDGDCIVLMSFDLVDLQMALMCTHHYQVRYPKGEYD
jgi:hypothetical protein